MGLEKDLPPGEQLLALFRPFLEYLASSDLSPKTIQRHVDNIWALDGEFIRHLHNESLKGECIRPGAPLSLEQARRLVEGYVEHYNDVRLNSAIGYITPKDMLAGRQQEIHAERDRKLEEARKQRQIRRQQAV